MTYLENTILYLSCIEHISMIFSFLNHTNLILSVQVCLHLSFSVITKLSQDGNTKVSFIFFLTNSAPRKEI